MIARAVVVIVMVIKMMLKMVIREVIVIIMKGKMVVSLSIKLDKYIAGCGGGRGRERRRGLEGM